MGDVVTGNKREDADLYNESQLVRGLVQSWGWPEDTSITRPDEGGTYDFDCSNPFSGEAVAVELKEVVSSNTLRDLDQNKGTTDWFDMKWPTAEGWKEIIRARMVQANKQLSAAGGKRRVVLLRLAYTPTPQREDLLWEDIMQQLRLIEVAEYPNVDELWFTTRGLSFSQLNGS